MNNANVVKKTTPSLSGNSNLTKTPTKTTMISPNTLKPPPTSPITAVTTTVTPRTQHGHNTFGIAAAWGTRPDLTARHRYRVVDVRQVHSDAENMGRTFQAIRARGGTLRVVMIGDQTQAFVPVFPVVVLRKRRRRKREVGVRGNDGDERDDERDDERGGRQQNDDDDYDDGDDNKKDFIIKDHRHCRKTKSTNTYKHTQTLALPLSPLALPLLLTTKAK